MEASLAALVVEAYVNGVPTRDMSLLAGSLGVSSLSASEVSRLTAELDGQVGELRSRRLDRPALLLPVGGRHLRQVPASGAARSPRPS